MSKNIKNKFKILKSVVADPDKKAEFRNVLLARIKRREATSQVENAGILPAVNWLEFALGKLKPAPILAMLLIFFISSASVGAAFASQDALPGELLYPVKIATEKIELAVTKDEIKKTELHLEFAAKRLNEAGQIMERNGTETQIDNLFLNYRNELNESRKILEDTGAKKPEIAVIVDQQTEINKKSMTVISGKIQRKIREGKLNKKYEDILEEAGEHAEKINDAANILIFTADQTSYKKENEIKNNNTGNDETRENSSSTENIKPAPTRAAIFSKKSGKKIKTAEEKISETEKHISELKKEGYATDFAEEKIREAKILLEESKSLANEQGYQKSLLQSIQARQTAEEAKRLSKKSKNNEEKRRDENNKDGEQTD